jgi:hypothetical protein
MTLGREISYSGAVYDIMISPSALTMGISPTTKDSDPLLDTLKAFSKIWKKLLDTPTQCSLPDPPLETRGDRGVSYEVSPTADGGKKILSYISEIINDGVVMSMSVSEQFLPQVLKWVHKEK